MNSDNLSTPAQETPEIQPVAEETIIPQETILEDETFEEKPARSKKWYIIGAVLIVFLAAAAFLGARLLNPQAAAGDLMGGNGMFLTSKGGPGGGKSVRINMTPAKELPQDRPAASGLFVRRDDQSIFIGTGNVRMTAKKSSDGGKPADLTSDYDGPVVEVVINHATRIYQDTTDMPEPDKAENGEIKVQQSVKDGSLDDLGTNSLVTVWGDKQGDRFIAKVIVFR